MERVGVFICHCGSNIGAVVDCARVAESVKDYPGVAFSTDYKYMCSEPGQEMIQNAIREHNLNRVVVASCSPRMHEKTFRACVAKAGLNEYMFEMANIREHCSWIHKDMEEATEKATILMRAAVAKVHLNAPLQAGESPVTKRALVIGGGIAGLITGLVLAVVINLLKGKNTNSALLAQVLNKNYVAARETLEAMENPDAMTYYIKAVLGARISNVGFVYDGLKKAVELDPSLAKKAMGHLEFAKYAKDATFCNILK